MTTGSTRPPPPSGETTESYYYLDRVDVIGRHHGRRDAVAAFGDSITSGEFGAVVDFERVLADPADPDRFHPDFDGGDASHPDDDGYRAMAAAIDLATL